MKDFSFVRRRPLFYAALAYAAILALAWRERPAENDLSRFAPLESVRLEGRIVSDIETRRAMFGDRSSFTLEADRLATAGGERRAGGRAAVYVNGPARDLSFGDRVRVEGRLERPRPSRSPGGYDAARRLGLRGIEAVFYADRHKAPVLVKKAGPSLGAAVSRLRGALARSVDRAFEPRDAAFLNALLLGKRDGLEDDLEALFARTGTIHVIAVSGFNVGFLALAAGFALSFLPISKVARLSVIALVILGYAILVGNQSPVWRAAVMAFVWIGASLSGRKSDLFNSLGLAALLILGFRPDQVFDLGFQLSFLTVLAIAACAPRFFKPRELWPNEKRSRAEALGNDVRALFWVSFVAALATLPLTSRAFSILTPLSPFANLAVVPLSMLLFFAGIVFFATFGIGAAVLAPLVAGLMTALLAALRVFEALPGAAWTCGRLPDWLWVVLTSGIVFLLWTPKIRKPSWRALVLVLFVADVFLAQRFLTHFPRPKPITMTVIDVGQGDSIYLEFPGGGNLLVDSGRGGDSDRGRRVVAPFLKSRGVTRLDAVVLTHPQDDHIGGFAALWDEFEITNVVESGLPSRSVELARLREHAYARGARIWHVRAGDRIEGYAGVRITALGPDDRPSRDPNDDSVLLLVEYGGTSFLFTGDAGREELEAIPARLNPIRADVLKVPHHGSKNSVSGAFLDRVQPAYAVVSAGARNSYGHPSPEALAALAAVPDCRTLRTDERGTLRFASDGRSVWASTWDGEKSEFRTVA